MDNNPNDLEAGLVSNFSRNFNKKMRKRKHLDALLKFRSTKKQSNDILRSSEDELFLPHQKTSITKLRSPSYRRCWNYLKPILSFSLVCIFMIICIGLTYANIELKNEVQNLSSRINEIEQKISNIQLNNISSTIEQIKSRLHLFEKSIFQTTNELDNSDQNTEIQLEDLIHKNIIKWDNQIKSFRNEIQNLNQSTKIQELKTNFEQLTNLVHNFSDKTSIIQTEFNKLENKIDECKCSKESIHLKPVVVDSDQLQQSIVKKPNIENSNNQTENTNNVEQIVNQPSITV